MRPKGYSSSYSFFSDTAVLLAGQQLAGCRWFTFFASKPEGKHQLTDRTAAAAAGTKPHNFSRLHVSKFSLIYTDEYKIYQKSSFEVIVQFVNLLLERVLKDILFSARTELLSNVSR